MKYPWRLNWPGRLERAFAVVVACAGAAVACGPEFPNSYYALPEGELLRAPAGFFADEIARIAKDVTVTCRAVRGKLSTVEIDVAGVRQALAARGLAPAVAGAIERDYRARRLALEAWVANQEKPETAGGPPPAAEFDARLPREFAGYFAGALAWHQGDWRAAARQWEAVLQLPLAERSHRSTWVAFMLGRTWVKAVEEQSEPERAAAQAAKYFQLTRELAAGGFPDPLGLAAASLGWEARARLANGEHATAIGLYLQQHAAGDETALASLRIAATRAARAADEELPALAADVNARRVVTAWFVSAATDHRGVVHSVGAIDPAQRWAAALQRAGVREVAEADRLAWLAYEAGLFPLAWEWIGIAPADSAEAQWLRAKLALRGGDLQRGDTLLRAALANPALAAAHRARVAAELSRVCLARDDFRGALEATLAGGHWEDAAFVAERVMTPEELKRFVDESPAEQPAGLRHLLARRLARLGRGAAVEPYYPEALRPAYRDYVENVRVGFDGTRPARERAGAFWRAARVAREQGLALLGTELEPDWAIWGADFQMDPSAARRRGAPEERKSLFAPTPVEEARLTEQPAPEKRFHYRYRAAELAWWAASLLPNDSDATADILATAGGWLKARDPQAAQPFYQALVIRCGNTALGRAAAEKRWFPEATPRAGE